MVSEIDAKEVDSSNNSDFTKALVGKWMQISAATFQNVVDSLPRRTESVTPAFLIEMFNNRICKEV